MDQQQRKSVNGNDNDNEMEVDEDEAMQDADNEQLKALDQGSTAAVMSILQGKNRDRTDAAIESLWRQSDEIGQWEKLLECLLLDHAEVDRESRNDTQDTGKTSSKGKKKETEADEAAIEEDADQDQAESQESNATEKARNNAEQVDEVSRLKDQEETLLLSVLVTSIRMTRQHAISMAKKVSFRLDQTGEMLDTHTCIAGRRCSRPNPL
jgi:hypothetical protein